MLDKGYHAICTIHSKENENEIAKNKNGLKEVELDLLNEGDASKFIQNVITEYSQIDVAVLTAGGFAMNDIEHTTTSDIYSQFRLNFETAYNIARPVFLQMIKQNSGRIFLIGSQAGLNVKNGKGTTAYALSKSLIFRLAELMNAEAKGKNVVVNVIVPNIIDTPENRASMPDADFSKWAKPSEIADIIYFYCTEEAKLLRNPVIQF